MFSHIPNDRPTGYSHEQPGSLPSRPLLDYQAMTADETTPLIRSRSRSGSGSDATASHEEKKSWLRRIGSVENRILFSGFLITLSFSYTQVAYVSLYSL